MHTEKYWAHVDLASVPCMRTAAPGPKSQALHARCSKHFKGLSEQVKLFPVAFASGKGCVLTDVDGNRYIDFSSGIYVTTLGHCHPKISEAVARYANTLMNAHDFTTEIKTLLVEKLAGVLPGDLSSFQFFDAGTAAVEAGIRVLRAATGKNELVSCFYDFHGKTYGAVSLAHIRSQVYGRVRAPGSHMVPRPDPYRPLWTKPDGAIDTDKYLEFYDMYLDKSTVGDVAGFVLEPIQGWGGSVMPPDDFFPKLRKFCDERKLLLMADEVLTSWGRTGKWLCLENWGVLPDVVAIGKGFGNGFPVTCVAVRDPFKESFERISASSSYGGNPMACAAALASTEVIEEENLLARSVHLGELALKRMARMKAEHKIVGDVRAKGCLMGIELVKDRATKEPFSEAGKRVYQKAFAQGLAWIPAGHILRMSPPIIMEDEVLLKGLDMIDQAIGETAGNWDIDAGMKTIGFGIIGGGLMGREFASAAARWGHLLEMDARPQLVALCDTNPALHGWYRENFPSLSLFTEDYRAVLANPAVQAVYVAVPHHLHQEIYCAAIEAGKHLMGEKPFGIDQKANQAILACAKKHPEVFVRCSSESIFFPAMQRLCEMIQQQAFGQIIEVNSGFLHCSDLDATKPINWKRLIEFNGEYGCMGDLGMHACHVPFRAGWLPRNVRAILSDIVKQRPDGKGGMAPCKTWDNATLLCQALDPLSGEPFPLTIKTQRIAPGQKNTWYTEVLGRQSSARWSSANPKLLEVLQYRGGEQIWQQIQTGSETAFKTLTGANFEFGFSDSILQMWAAYLYELVHGRPLAPFAGCVTGPETHLSHRLFTAALESQRHQSVVAVADEKSTFP